MAEEVIDLLAPTLHSTQPRELGRRTSIGRAPSGGPEIRALHDGTRTL